MLRQGGQTETSLLTFLTVGPGAGVAPVVALFVASTGALGFTYLVGPESTRARIPPVAGMIASVPFTLGSLEYPLSGTTRVGREAFEVILGRFEAGAPGDLR